MPIQARCLICGDCHRDGLVPDCPPPQRAVAARIVSGLVLDCPPPQRAVAARIVSGLGGFEIVG
jgi:hypothetical protein